LGLQVKDGKVVVYLLQVRHILVALVVALVVLEALVLVLNPEPVVSVFQFIYLLLVSQLTWAVVVVAGVRIKALVQVQAV